jgi:hypothetical protein
MTLARNGMITYAKMQHLEKSQQIKSVAVKERLPIHVMHLDVRDEASANNAVQEICPKLKK